MNWLVERWRATSETDRAATLLLLLFVLLALAYGLSNPLFEATDEIRHFRYVRYIQTERSLPPLTSAGSGQYQAHHPPLYYLTVAALSAWVPGDLSPALDPPTNPYWGYRYFEVSTDNKAQYLHNPAERFPGQQGYQTVWIGRLVSLLFALGTAVVSYRLGRVLYPDYGAVALGALAFVAFNPMFLHGAGSMNNDSTAAFFGALAALFAALVVQDGLTPRRGLALGLAFGLAALSKANVLPLAAPVGLAALWAVWRQRDRQAWQGLGLLALAGVITIGPWLLRNWVLTGSLLGSSAYTAAWTGDGGNPLGDLISGAGYTWSTFWARFNYGQVPVAGWMYWLPGVLLVGSLAGLAVRKIRVNWVLPLALVVMLGGWVYLMLTVPATNNARMLFPVYPVLGVLLARGLAPEHRSLRLALILPGLALAYAVVALVGYLRPAYAYPDLRPLLFYEGDNATLGDVAEVVAYEVDVDADGLQPGDDVVLRVWWAPLRQTGEPWSVFVHLLDEDGILVAQRDTWPGLGNAPTTTWRTNSVFTDSYRVRIPAGTYAPNRFEVRFGLWNPASGERALAQRGDEVDGESIVAGEYALYPLEGPAPNLMSANFDNVIELIGYELDTRTPHAGDTLQVTSYWWLESPMTTWYNIFVQVVDTDGNVWAIQDSGMLPPSQEWPTFEVRLEVRDVPLPADLPPGEYMLRLGMRYEGERNGDRLPVLYPNGLQAGDFTELGRIRVIADDE